MKSLAFAYIILNIFSLPEKRKQVHPTEIVSVGTYTITRIDTINNVYVLYTRKNGLDVRIISPKSSVANCNNLIKGKPYKLTLVELFNVKSGGTKINYYQVFGINFTLGPGENVYGARNIKGLCVEE